MHHFCTTLRSLVLILMTSLFATGCFGMPNAIVHASDPQTADPCTGPNPIVQKPDFNLVQIASGLSSPLYVTSARDNSGRLFIVEQTGTIRILQDGKPLAAPFLNLGNRTRGGGEQGLLSVAFHPNYAQNGRLFVDYTRAGDGATIIAEFHVGSDPNLADLASEHVLLVIRQPFSNHNGGLVKFGPDGYLYIGMGDGGSGGDPQGNGQNLSVLLGKLLRIDVDNTDGKPYAIPADNPFINTTVAGKEVYAYGLRNPWRYSFDRCNGRLFLADVGQGNYEEIDLIDSGGNYGWNTMEGTHCFHPSSGCNRTGLTLPIAEYDHSAGDCAVTGGYVYRGTEIPDLDGHYLFADYCTGHLWSLVQDSTGQWQMTQLRDLGFNISSLGEDQEGELYIVDLGGAVYKITK
ncbi:PQQ-dependent sugar dehydrogenase [Candidatus Acetothermia bacterium]|nr:PQQ-dependent sugar dehydrogenase [Candidatus Acetothermia bacterium]MBI3644142.1 PQQ-dependent sugar dehydrogenase [Candidatus Acetothermia bacterium]